MNKFKELYMKSLCEIDKLTSQFNQLNRVIIGQNPHKFEDINSKSYRIMLQAEDGILCSTRYFWDLPINLTSEQLEFMLYSCGSLCMFENDKGELEITRFAKVGGLNWRGQLDKIQPIDFAGNTYDVVRSVITGKNDTVTDDAKVAVILRDYTHWGDLELSRHDINAGSTINDQVTVYGQMINNIIVSIKKAIGVCQNEDQKKVLEQELESLLDPSSPIGILTTSKGKKPLEELPVDWLNFNNNFDVQNYCNALEYYDRKRRTFNGIPSPDTFEKKERMITSEAENSNTHTSLILLNGFEERKHSVELFKKYCKNDKNKNISVRINPALIDEINNEEDEKNGSDE